MTNNRVIGQSVTAGDIARRAAQTLQTRSSVFPIIELVGKNQTLTAGVSAPISWNEILRQTDQPITSYRTTGNYLWPRFVNAGTGSYDYQIQVGVAGYYNISLFTVVTTATTVTLRLTLFDSSGTQQLYLVNQLYASTTQQMFNTMIYINERQILQFNILSPVANTLLTTTLPSNTGAPSPRLIIAQVAQFTDSLIGKTTRLSSTISGSLPNNTVQPVSLTTQPAGAVSNLADGYTYNAGGSNQMDGGWDTVNNNRVYVKYSGRYLLTAQILQTAGANTGTRTIVLAIDGSQVVASMSQAATITSNRNTHVSTIAHVTAGSYVAMYGFQDTGVGVTLNPTPDLHRLTVTYLGE
jgi:hypothetical protein